MGNIELMEFIMTPNTEKIEEDGLQVFEMIPTERNEGLTTTESDSCTLIPKLI